MGLEAVPQRSEGYSVLTDHTQAEENNEEGACSSTRADNSQSLARAWVHRYTDTSDACLTYPTTALSASVCSSRKCRPPSVKRCNPAGIPFKHSSSCFSTVLLRLLLMLWMPHVVLVEPYTCALRCWMASFRSLTVVDPAEPTSSATVRDVLPLLVVAGSTTKSSMVLCWGWIALGEAWDD